MIIDREAKKYLVDELAKLRTDLDAIDAYLAQQIVNQDNNIKDLEIWIDAADEPVIIPPPPPPPDPEPEPVDKRIWFCDFETGDFSEINKVGAIIFQNSARAKAGITSDQAHSGKYSLALTINTPTTGSTAAYCFIWEDFMPKEAIFRCWYYIPAAVKPGAWWNIWQWKSNPVGKDSSQGLPMYCFGIGSDGTFNLIWRPDSNSLKKFYGSSLVAPRNQWFLLEAYYRTATDKTGKIVASVNGHELWNIEGNPTAASDQKMFWSVNNYAENISPDPCTIYVDDMEILAV